MVKAKRSASVKSIRSFLIIVILAVICLSNFIAALQGFRNSLDEADQLVDRQIKEKFNVISSLVNHRVQIPAALFDDNTIFQFWQDKTLQAYSSNAPVEPIAFTGEGFHQVSYDGRRWQTYSMGNSSKNYLLVVGQRVDLYEALVNDILLKAIIPIIWVLPLLAILIWLIVYFGLNPIKQLALRLSQRKVDDFSRYEGSEYPDEMLPIVNSLNELFDRLNNAFEREKRFSADAAHELRTPLAALTVGLHNISDGVVNQADLSSLTASVEKMRQCIEQLLELHQVSSGDRAASFTDCNLHAISQDVISDLYSAIAHKTQSIELLGQCDDVLGDSFSLSVLVRNLIENASKYTPAGGAVLVSVQNMQGAAVLTVEDSGIGISEDQYERVTQRFYRVGGDRHASGVIGSGLGLSIVSFVAYQHGATISLSKSQSLGGLAVRVSFNTGVVDSETA